MARCRLLQCVALQSHTGCCRVLQGVDGVAGCCRVLQGVAGRCKVLQGVAGCCRVLQGVECVARRCSVLQGVAGCCRLLQCVQYIWLIRWNIVLFAVILKRALALAVKYLAHLIERSLFNRTKGSLTIELRSLALANLVNIFKRYNTELFAIAYCALLKCRALWMRGYFTEYDFGNSGGHSHKTECEDVCNSIGRRLPCGVWLWRF